MSGSPVQKSSIVQQFTHVSFCAILLNANYSTNSIVELLSIFLILENSGNIEKIIFVPIACLAEDG